MNDYLDVNKMTREELIEEFKRSRSTVYQRQYARQKDPKMYSQVGVEAYRKHVDYLKSRYEWYRPTGGLKDATKAPISELRAVVSDYLYMENLPTLTAKGAKAYMQMSGNVFGEGYQDLTQDEQSALWRLHDRLLDGNPDLTSDEVNILLKKKLSGDVDLTFGKDGNGETQVTGIVLPNGDAYDIDPSGSVKDIQSLIEGMTLSFQDTLDYAKFRDARADEIYQAMKKYGVNFI